MNIFEIIGATPLPGKWLDKHRAVFEHEDLKFGIYITFTNIFILTTSYQVVNISFGTYKDTFEGEEDLNLSLTGVGNARIVFSTVATACLKNTYLTSSDLIVMVGNDEAKEHRAILYSAAANEILNKIKRFRDHKILYATNIKGDLFVAIAKSELNDEELQIIADHYQVGKIKRVPPAS